MAPQGMRLALVGGGVVARWHVEAIQRLGPEVRLVVVVGRHGGSGHALADAVGVEASTSLEEVLARSDVDGVVVCTPSGMHADTAVAALEAGKHVLVEKPLDVSLAAALRVLATARRTGLVASVVSQHRFDPGSRAVHAAVRSGQLGRLTSCLVSTPWWRDQAYYDSADWRGTAAMDGGTLLNQAVHGVDLMTWLVDVPDEVFCRTARLAHERIDVEDTAVATVRFPSGALGVVHATTAAFPGAGARVQVHGDRGSAVLDGDRLIAFTTQGESFPDVATPPTRIPGDAFVAQYEDFVAAARDERPPMVDVAAGVQTLAVIQAMYESAATGLPARVHGLAGRE